MNKRTFLLTLLLMMMASTVSAESISENQARKIAIDFMSQHAIAPTGLKMVQKSPTMNASTGKMAYYVFNATRGYVIVAGDDRVPAVLGYSDQGTFDHDNVPEALQELLDGYAAQIEAIAQGATPVKMRSSGHAISPLVKSSWSQNAPYNTMLPILSNGNQAVAGCVATAMAQVMYHWKWPARPTTTIPEYTTQNLGIYMPALEPVDFNWEAMQDTYLDNDTESDGAKAAAQLTLYCAQSVKMNFLYTTSGANTTLIPAAMASYFGYKASAHCEYRENFTTQGWADLLYSELNEGRPVIYSGSKKSSGHAFICDGYNGEGMFHINWGWNGMSNGYYVLEVLNPDAQGTGSASEAYGYIYKQYIVAGIEPGEGVNEFAITAGNVALNDAVTTRTSSDASFKATVSGGFFNYTSQTLSASIGWGLYQENDLVSVLYQSNVAQLQPNYVIRTNNQQLSFGSGITSGTYRIVPIYSELYDSNWRPCKGADVNYIEVTIDGDNCLVAGKGTAGERNYTVNSITHNGSMHHGRPVDLAVNMTNNGYSQNDLLHMFVNGTFNSTAFLGLAHGETGDISFRFLPTTPGTYTCTFSFNEDGSDPVAQTTINIEEMPVTNLSITAAALNVTDAQQHIITSDKFSVKLTIANNGDNDYYDDVTVKLYKNLDGTYGSNAQMANQLISLNPGQTTEVQFDLDNVIDGWDYFVAVFYYSNGQQVHKTSTPYYTIVFPEETTPLLGDVNGDGELNISDVILFINYILNDGADGFIIDNADFNSDGFINISDAIDIINYTLNN